MKLSARDVMQTGGRFGGALQELGTEQHDRVATLVENSPTALHLVGGHGLQRPDLGADQHRLQG